MPALMLIAAGLALAAQPAEEEVKVVGRPWAPFISPMGEPFRANSPTDDPLARWFYQADRNRDGLTLDEMQADAARFFAKLDSNGDGQIDPEEITVYESEIAQEVQVNTRWKRSPEALALLKSSDQRDEQKRWRADRNVDGYQVEGLQGAARYGLLNMPEPVAAADADFNRATTSAEFQHAAAVRFQLLDSKKAGRLTLADLEPLLPTRPKNAKVHKFPDEQRRDTRIGLPLPEGN